jgi:hypothetical protein
MRGAAHERARTLRAWRMHLPVAHHTLPEDESDLGCACELQPNRFRKTDRLFGCGKVRCYQCKREKLTGVPNRRTRAGTISYHEWLDELGVNRTRRRMRDF